MSDINLKKIFEGLQAQMVDKLSSNRDIISHPTTKGDASELNWIKWMRDYLPKRYCVDKAFVVDSNDRFSEQQDLVIYDRQYSPFVFNQDGAIYIPAESVYAVFEVKQELDKAMFEYAAKKIESVRVLNRTSAQIVHAGGEIKNPKLPFRIVGGILTLANKWKDPFGKPFKNCLQKFNSESQIDIGCVLKNGSFTVDYEPNISFQISTPDEALLYFFFKLLTRLQTLGTVPAMDIEAYARVLNSI